MEPASFKISDPESYLIAIGRVLREIDEQMMAEGKRPISMLILGKEVINIRDFVSIINKIASRYVYYLSGENKSKVVFFMDTFPESFWNKLKELEKEKKIKFYLFTGYMTKEGV